MATPFLRHWYVSVFPKPLAVMAIAAF